MTVDEILEKKADVCIHKTILYNSFLNCIEIDAISAIGYAHTNQDINIDFHTLHAWSVAKINGKWIPLDATWDFFFGKFPLGHIFLYFGENYQDIQVDWSIISNLISFEIQKINGFLDSNPQISNKLTAIKFISREKEDDDDGDFDINEENFVLKFLLFIIIIIIAIGFIIGIYIIIKKIKKSKKSEKTEIEFEKKDDLTISIF